jgi:hypothetical protein
MRGGLLSSPPPRGRSSCHIYPQPSTSQCRLLQGYARVFLFSMTFSHHISACLVLHVTTIAIPVAAIPPVLLVYILLLFVSVSASHVFSFVLARFPYGRVFLFAYIVYCLDFRRLLLGYEESCGLRL